MSDLDDKLKEIVDEAYDEAGMRSGVENTIAQIKQAFAEEGYVQMAYNPYKKEVAGKPIGPILETDNNFMTGQEWYDRFEREYHMRADWIGGDPEMGDDAEHDVLLAAKLASGIQT